MAYVWILLAFVDLPFLVLSDYNISSNRGTWMEMRKSCNLATPAITYSSRFNTLNLDTEINLRVGGKVWVGYTMDMEVFRYIGCFPKRAVESSGSHTLQADVGQCYSACNPSPFFGFEHLQGQNDNIRCHCVTNVKSEEITYCGTQNDIGKEFAFGGNSKVSVYQNAASGESGTLKNIPSWDGEFNNCLCLYLPRSSTFQWTYCNISYQFLCTQGWNERIYNVTNDYGEWRKSSESCLRKGFLMLPYKENRSANFDQQLWTSNIRASVVNIETGTYNSKYIKYGYVERINENQYILKFDIPGDNMMYQALCENTGRDQDTLTSTDKNNNSGGDGNSEGGDGNSEGGDGNGEGLNGNSEGGDGNSEGLNGNSEGGNGKIGLYVGVPVVVILILGAMTIVIVFLWRRKRQRPENARPTEILNTKQNLSYDGHTINNTSTPDADYHEIDDTNIVANGKKDYLGVHNELEASGKSNDGDYDELSEEYDRLQKHDKNSNHQYSILENNTVHPINGYNKAIHDDSKVADKHDNVANQQSTNTYSVLEKTPQHHLHAFKNDKNNDYEFATETESDLATEMANYNHIYNKATHVVGGFNDTYDHINKGSAAMGDEGEDQPYDLTSKPGIPNIRDPTYDHTG